MFLCSCFMHLHCSTVECRVWSIVFRLIHFTSFHLLFHLFKWIIITILFFFCYFEIERLIALIYSKRIHFECFFFIHLLLSHFLDLVGFNFVFLRFAICSNSMHITRIVYVILISHICKYIIYIQITKKNSAASVKMLRQWINSDNSFLFKLIMDCVVVVVVNFFSHSFIHCNFFFGQCWFIKRFLFVYLLLDSKLVYIGHYTKYSNYFDFNRF